MEIGAPGILAQRNHIARSRRPRQPCRRRPNARHRRLCCDGCWGECAGGRAAADQLLHTRGPTLPVEKSRMRGSSKARQGTGSCRPDMICIGTCVGFGIGFAFEPNGMNSPEKREARQVCGSAPNPSGTRRKKSPKEDRTSWEEAPRGRVARTGGASKGTFLGVSAMSLLPGHASHRSTPVHRRTTRGF